MMDRFQKAWGWHTLKILIVLKKSGGKKDKCHCRERPFFQTSLLHPRIGGKHIFIRCYYRSVLIGICIIGVYIFCLLTTKFLYKIFEKRIDEKYIKLI